MPISAKKTIGAKPEVGDAFLRVEWAVLLLRYLADKPGVQADGNCAKNNIRGDI